MRKGILALSPILFFAIFYLASSLIAGDFYKIPITVSFLLASILAIAITEGPVHKRISVFSRGAGDPQLLLMIWIFILAGAFANTAKAMGAIDATVGATLSILPGHMLLASVFLAACFISFSIGTSVGTIVALTPIAVGVATQTSMSIPMMAAIVVGGSFFGDNLSFISDTTIVATQSQGCKTRDKFRVNLFIVLPAALLLLAYYVYLGHDVSSPSALPAVSVWKLLPYLAVIVTAVVGVNVIVVLTVGILLSGIIGIADGSFDFFGLLGVIGDGIISMGELIIISMMAGGLLAVVKHNGGIDFIIHQLIKLVRGKRGAELSIGALVSVVNLCTANNTVAIITVGGIARKIGERYHLDARKCASILDTFACTVQGLIPYGVQLLMVSGLSSTDEAKVNPMEIIPFLYYPIAIGLSALLAILLRYPRRYS